MSEVIPPLPPYVFVEWAGMVSPFTVMILFYWWIFSRRHVDWWIFNSKDNLLQGVENYVADEANEYCRHGR